MEGQTQTYKLEDAKGEVVELLVQWLYTQTFDIELDLEPKADHEAIKKEFLPALNTAIELWVLADKLILRKLQNQITSWIILTRKANRLIPTTCLHEVYRSTGPGSPLRHLFVSHCARKLKTDFFLNLFVHKQIPHEMLVDLVAYFSANFVAKTEAEDDKSFHVEVMLFNQLPGAGANHTQEETI